MKKFFKENILPVLSTILLSIILPLNNWDKAQIAIAILTSYLILWLISKYLLPTLNAQIQMYTVSKIRGLLGNKYLETTIKRQYKKSSIIKIKVTRGIGLFASGKVFYKCLFVDRYNDEKTVKILLHYPCLRASHIIERAKANGVPKENYVKDLFKTLKMFKAHSRDKEQDEKIFIKFYTSQKEKEWRFYIFKNHNEGKVLLFNHYNDKIQGSKSKMLKVNGGSNSLCDDMDKSFDNIFNNASLELVNNNLEQQDLMNDDFCGHSECKTLINKIYKEYF